MASSFGRDRVLRLAEAAAWTILIVYLVTLGGTEIGERVGALRLLNGLLAGGAAAFWLYAARRSHDTTDDLVVFATAIFMVVCSVAVFRRQAFDAAVTVLGTAALFYFLRRRLRFPTVRDSVMVGLGIVSLALSCGYVVRWGDVWARWLNASDFSSWPPLTFLPDPGFYAQQHYLALVALLTVPALWTRPFRGVLRVASIVGSVATAALVIAGGSRTLWVSALVAFVVIGVAAGYRRLRRTVSLRWAGLAAITALVVLAVGPGEALIRRIMNLSTISGREALWTSSLEAFLQRPLTGFGPGGWVPALTYTSYFNGSPFAQRNPDNAVIQLLVEAGLIGMVSLGLAAASVVIPIVRRRGMPLAATWSLVAFGVSCAALNPSDFIYLVVVAVVWSALAAPYATDRTDPEPTPLGRLLAAATPIGAAALLAGVTLSGVAAIAYDNAVSASLNRDYADALGQAQVAMSLDPSLGLYARSAGSLEVELGLPAAEALNHALQVQPNDTASMRQLALLALSQGDLTTATNLSRRAITVNGSDEANLLLGAMVAKRSGDQPQEIRYLADVLALHPALVLSDWPSDLGVNRSTVDRAANQFVTQARRTGDVYVGSLLVAVATGEGATLAYLPIVPGEKLAQTAGVLQDIAQCDPVAARRDLAAAFSSDGESVWYWTVHLVTQAFSPGVPLAPTRAVTAVYLESLTPHNLYLTGGALEDIFYYRRTQFPALGSAIRIPEQDQILLTVAANPQRLLSDGFAGSAACTAP